MTRKRNKSLTLQIIDLLKKNPERYKDRKQKSKRGLILCSKTAKKIKINKLKIAFLIVVNREQVRACKQTDDGK